MALSLVFLAYAFFSPDMVPPFIEVSQHRVVDEERCTKVMRPRQDQKLLLGDHCGAAAVADTFPIGIVPVRIKTEQRGCIGHGRRHGGVGLERGEMEIHGSGCSRDRITGDRASIGRQRSIRMKSGRCCTDSSPGLGANEDCCLGELDLGLEHSVFERTFGQYGARFTYSYTSHVYNISVLANYTAYLSGTANNKLINISCGPSSVLSVGSRTARGAPREAKYDDGGRPRRSPLPPLAAPPQPSSARSWPLLAAATAVLGAIAAAACLAAVARRLAPIAACATDTLAVCFAVDVTWIAGSCYGCSTRCHWCDRCATRSVCSGAACSQLPRPSRLEGPRSRCSQELRLTPLSLSSLLWLAGGPEAAPETATRRRELVGNRDPDCTLLCCHLGCRACCRLLCCRPACRDSRCSQVRRHSPASCCSSS